MTGKTLFAQLMDFLPWSTFTRIVARYDGDHRVRAHRQRGGSPGRRAGVGAGHVAGRIVVRPGRRGGHVHGHVARPASRHRSTGERHTRAEFAFPDLPAAGEP